MPEVKPESASEAICLATISIKIDVMSDTTDHVEATLIRVDGQNSPLAYASACLAAVASRMIETIREQVDDKEMCDKLVNAAIRKHTDQNSDFSKVCVVDRDSHA